jgi:hypothetical protein
MGNIRGEYWINDGYADFADGDVGDMNHEGKAIQYLAGKHVDNIINIAADLGVELDHYRNEEYPSGDIEEIRKNLIDAVENKEIEWDLPDGVEASDSVDHYLQQQLGIGDEEYSTVLGYGAASLYCMEHEGWIAVRSNNVEFYGYDENKRKEIVRGIDDVLTQELIEEPDEQIELYLYDYKTKRSWDATLAELRNTSGVRPNTLPNTTYNTPFFLPTKNIGPKGSESPRYVDAQTRSLASTSENVHESNNPRKAMKSRWSLKYKRSINCKNSRGFSQKNYCNRQRRGGKYMESFKQWLEIQEATMTGTVSGWLAPSGRFYPCQRYMFDHLNVILTTPELKRFMTPEFEDALKKLDGTGKVPEDHYDNLHDAIEQMAYSQMYRRGYLRVAPEGNTVHFEGTSQGILNLFNKAKEIANQHDKKAEFQRVVL